MSASSDDSFDATLAPYFRVSCSLSSFAGVVLWSSDMAIKFMLQNMQKQASV